MRNFNNAIISTFDHISVYFFKKIREQKESLKNSMKEQYPSLDANILDKLQCGLPALSLCSLTALNTAICNDTDPNLIYAQSVFGLGNKGDVLICISTSGNAKTVCAAAQVAKALGILVIGLTGSTGGKLKEIADICGKSESWAKVTFYRAKSKLIEDMEEKI